MRDFRYQAYASDGSRVTGEVRAETDAAALAQLSGRGLTPVTLTMGNAKPAWWNRDISLFGEPSLPQRELQSLFATLATMLQAGFGLPRAIAFCEEQTVHRRTRATLSSIRQRLDNGSTLSDAMEHTAPAVPARFRALIRIGERSNQLPQIVADVAEFMTNEAQFRRELRSALLYPAILLIMSALVLSVVVFFLAPTLLPVFASLDAPPPPFLDFMASAGAALTANWQMVLVALALMITIALLGRQFISSIMSRVMLRLPLIGTYLRRRESLRMAQALFLMLKGGSQLPEAISVACEAVSFAPYRRLLREAEAAVTGGGRLAPALAERNLIDPTTLGLLAAGEESDRFQPLLRTAIETLRHQTSQALKQAIQVLSPTLTLVIGLGIGALILSTISAIMDLNDIGL
ncbi:type II secretion system F family protein [Boseongicola sp. H5]|uniref:type II secretion system F family protein n=1 Tax=Boseongicola sp. H5 TaxID=2763261 RepID=UPI001D0B9B2C|nr:type II secretion system F family protein [Boseongicola sp. H5]